MRGELLAINSDKVVHETIDNEVIIINLDTGTYYSLVETGLDVWQAIEQGVSRPAMDETLARLYDADPSQVSTALDEFIGQLLSEEIVVTTSGEANGQTSWHSQPARPGPFTPPTLARYTNMSDLLLLDPIHDVNEQGWPNRKQD